MSKAALAFACSYGFRMDVPVVERPAGRPAQVGSCFHKLAECRVKGVNVAAHADDPSIVADALALYKSPIQAFLDSRPWTACEIGLEYDAASDTAIACPRRGDEGYESVEPMRLRGTLDLAHVDGDTADVVDLKTGQKQNSHAEQLYVQAVAVSRFYNVKKVRVAFAYARKTKFDAPVFEELDEDRLDYEADRIARVLRQLPMAEPNRGDHCWTCDARQQCPAWNYDAA
jgi:hypothetical protein